MKYLTLIMAFSFLALMSKAAQDSVVTVLSTSTCPTIDGKPDDACWATAKWQPINEVWIKWGCPIDSSDFYGRYKVVWSENENMIYFLAEITDDSFIEGYKYPERNYPDYDIFEVFVDEDQSGGKHVFTGNDKVGYNLGRNAYNAFSYHIAPVQNFSGDSVINQFAVCDLDGESWQHFIIPNYRNHFGNIVLAKHHNKYYWEFSLKIYKDNYSNSSPEKSRRNLKPGSYLNVSVAYCDADGNVGRDNFIGSVAVTKERYNHHWDDADDYGTFYLMDLVQK